jgi:hypothetical protein
MLLHHKRIWDRAEMFDCKKVVKVPAGLMHLFNAPPLNFHPDNLNNHIVWKYYPTLKEKSKLFSYIFNIATKNGI